ncbi:MAG: LPS-assembly protein LptD, partial [Pseudomonadota bacterium]
MRRALIGLVAVWLWVGPVAAQDPDLPATLVADAIRFDRPTETITASGTVEVFFDGAVLQAQTVRYDGRADVLTVEGPLVFIDETGRTVFFADLAELSGDLQNAMLRSSRLVLDRQLQIAAAEIDRVDGRFTQAFQTVATTCEVCAENPRPLWEIRA